MTPSLMMNMVKRISACVLVAAALKVRSRAARPSQLRPSQHGRCPALRRRAAHHAFVWVLR
jgi:hypothetical protein